MKHSYCILSVIALSMCVMGCNIAKESVGLVTGSTKKAAMANLVGMRNANYIPKAVIYKTNGDYNDNVTVNLNESRTSIASYPAPSDVGASSAALPIGDGWLLDRRGGIGANTAFLTYTYSEYAGMKTAPSPSVLMESIIPEAKVTEIRTLPITIDEALADPESLTKYIH